MSGAGFDDEATVDVDEALLLLAQIRAEVAQRASEEARGAKTAAPGGTSEALDDEGRPAARTGKFDEDVPTIEGYGALREIGRGGFSRVFEALQFEFERWVAIKVLNDALDDDMEIATFKRECRLMGGLSRHPNIVTVFASALTSERRPGIVMELFPHGSYLDIIQSTGPLELGELLSLGVWISGALAMVHRQGMTHGDVKPQNIFRSEYGSAVLGDFGIATLMNHGLSDTKTGLSPYYAAPELIERGVSATSPFADQYSLGATIYTLATGHRPFETDAGETTGQLFARTLSEPAPRLGGDFPPPLADAVEQAMAREPHQRHRDVVAFAAAIAKVETELGLKPTEIPVTSDLGRYVGQTPGLDQPSRTATSSRAVPSFGLDDKTMVRPSKLLDTASPAPESAEPQQARRIPLWAKIAAVACVVVVVAAVLVLVGGAGTEVPEAPVPADDSPASPSEREAVPGKEVADGRPGPPSVEVTLLSGSTTVSWNRPRTTDHPSRRT